MTEFWLISAPGEKTCQQTWEKLHAATTKNNNLAATSKFDIPDLKVTLAVQIAVEWSRACMCCGGVGRVERALWSLHCASYTTCEIEKKSKN